MNSVAFLCTGQAPTGMESFKIQSITGLALIAVVTVYVLLLRLVKHKIQQRVIRIVIYIISTVILVSALGWGYYLYVMSTCGY